MSAEWHEDYDKTSKFPVEGYDGGSVSVLTVRVGRAAGSRPKRIQS